MNCHKNWNVVENNLKNYFESKINCIFKILHFQFRIFLVIINIRMKGF